MKTKEELLKIYSAYLPYELKGKRTDGAKGDYILRAVYDDGSIIWKYDGFGNSTQIGVLPVLYSMDMLTKEIEHKSERFIPLHKILEEYCFDLSKMDDEEILSYAESLIEIDMTVTTYNLLLEWNFNVFNLDESEYIKKETSNVNRLLTNKN